MHQPEYMLLITQIQTLRRSIDIAATNISESTQSYTHPKYNRLLWDEAAECVRDKPIEDNFDLKLDTFIAKLVDNELEVVFECFVKLKNIMTTIGKE